MTLLRELMTVTEEVQDSVHNVWNWDISPTRHSQGQIALYPVQFVEYGRFTLNLEMVGGENENEKPVLTQG
jgi:hypothetical protein